MSRLEAEGFSDSRHAFELAMIKHREEVSDLGPVGGVSWDGGGLEAGWDLPIEVSHDFLGT